MGQENYEVKATFETIEMIEQRFDLVSFLQSIGTKRPKMSDVTWVLYCAIVKAGYKVKYNDLGEIVQGDLWEAAASAAEFTQVALEAGPEKK